MELPKVTTSKSKSETPTSGDVTSHTQKTRTTSSTPLWSPFSPATTQPFNSGSRPTSQHKQNGKNTWTEGSQTPLIGDPFKPPCMPFSPGPTLTQYPSPDPSSDTHLPSPPPFLPRSKLCFPAQDYYSQWFARVVGWQLTA